MGTTRTDGYPYIRLGYYNPYYLGVGFGFAFFGGYYAYWSYPGPYGYYGLATQARRCMCRSRLEKQKCLSTAITPARWTTLTARSSACVSILASIRSSCISPVISVQQELYLQPGNTFDIETTLAPLGPANLSPHGRSLHARLSEAKAAAPSR